jgi:hypothetical protein
MLPGLRIDDAPSCERPLLFSIEIDRVEVVIPGTNVDRAVRGYRRRRIHCDRAGRNRPLFRAVSVDCVQIVVIGSDIHGVVGSNCRPGNYLVSGRLRELREVGRVFPIFRLRGGRCSGYR